MGIVTWPFSFSISMRFHSIHSTTDSLPEAKLNILGKVSWSDGR